MTPDELRDRVRAHSLFYDEQPLPRLDLADLDLDAVTRYLGDTNQVDFDDDLVRLLRAWRMYDGSHPTVGGLVLFGRRPQAELESSRVVVGALAGDDIGDNFVDRKDLSGPLLSVIAQIETFLRLHLKTGHEIVGFEKEKREEIPMAALREFTAVTSLMTSTLDIIAEPKSSRAGHKPPKICGTRHRAARNELLKDVMRDYGYLEHMGLGVPRKIVRGMQEFNGSEPEFVVGEESLTIVLRREPE